MKKRESSLPSTGKTAAFERDWKEEEAKISAFEVILAKSLWIAKGIGGGGGDGRPLRLFNSSTGGGGDSGKDWND